MTRDIYTSENLMELVEIVCDGDFELLEGARVVPDQAHAPKRWSEDLTTEWLMLLRQFGEGSALAFAIPILTPLLRRKIDEASTLPLYYRLWDEYPDFLLENLNARWLVSCCDTFIKRPRNDAELAWAFAGALFMKTIKMYETELLRLDDFPPLLERPIRVDPEEHQKAYGRLMLFEGIQAFNVRGRGDMVWKTEERLMRSGEGQVVARIVQELWRRAHQNETIYRRLQQANEALDREEAAKKN